MESIENSGFSLAGYVGNAFDHSYDAGGIAEGPARGVNVAQPGLPCTFFFKGSWQF